MERQTGINSEINITPEDLADKYNQEVADFFESEAIKDIEIKIFDSKSELVDYYKKFYQEDKEPPDYLVAFSPQKIIAILGPDVMPSDEAGPGSQRFNKVMKHELAHKYIEQLGGRVPGWLSEGTCCHVANQSKGNVKLEEINLKLLNELSNTQDGRKYVVGKNMVDEIVGNYGKEKLFKLLKMTDKEELYAELKRMFSWLI
jgi:hypothetical protein